MVKDLCSPERLKSLGATKKLKNIGIIINGLVEGGDKVGHNDSKDDKVSLRLEESIIEMCDELVEKLTNIINWNCLTQDV